jgi:RNA polymerase sigma-70 factor (ECF subfamily)
MNVADVATALSIPDETVKTRYFRARQRLREQILERIEGVERQAFPFYRLRCDRVVSAVLSRLQRL